MDKSIMRPSGQTVEPAQAARAWRAHLPAALRRRSDLYGGLLLAGSLVLYGGMFVGMFVLPVWPMRLAVWLVAPLIIGMLFVLGHDACHGTLFRQGWLNRVGGRVALLPAWHPFTSWAQAHNIMHHGWTNFKGRHPDFAPLSKAEFDRLPRWRQGLERVYRAPLGIGLAYLLEFYGKHLLWPRPEHRSPARLPFQLDRLLVAGFLAAQLAAAWALTAYVPAPVLPAAWHAVAAVYVPWLLWLWGMGVVSFLQHTHPGLAWYDKAEEWSFYHVQLTSTVHVVFPWPLERLLYNIMDHPAHHLDPTIPLYHLPHSQRVLEAQCAEHTTVYAWTLGAYVQICATCKLYDFERHCWLNFDGEPTTPGDLCGPRPRRQ